MCVIHLILSNESLVMECDVLLKDVLSRRCLEAYHHDVSIVF